MTQSIVISHTTIGQDAQGRYCLNHLHRAAGGNKRHQPSNWLRTDIARALVAELEKERTVACEDLSSSEMRSINPLNQVIGRGKEQGTFAVKELVYAYAMWISPKFHLHVIRAFDGQAPQLAAPELDHNALIVKMWAQVDTLHAQITERDAQITRLLAEQQQTLLAQSYQINHLQGQLIGSKDKQIDLMASVQRLKTMREKRDAHDTAVRMAREGKGNIEIAAAINRTPNHVRQILFQARAAGVLPPLPAAPMVASPQATLFTEAA